MNTLHITDEALEKIVDKLSTITEIGDEVTISFKNGNMIKFKVLEVKKIYEIQKKTSSD